MNLLGKKLLFFTSILLIALILRDIPYINILSANKIWLVYVFLLIFLILPREGNSMVYLAIVLLFITLALTLFNLINLAEAFGVIIYFLLLAIVFVRVFSLRKE